MKITILTTAMLLITLLGVAQKEPLKGSGNIVSKSFNYTNFKSVHLSELDGKAIIEVGKSFSIHIDIDDNLESLLNVVEKDGTLSIYLKGNKNNKMYIEDTKVKITITLPLLESVLLNGNNSLEVQNIKNESLAVKCKGNGSIQLSGTANNLEAICTSNGNINATNLVVQFATLKSRGNGSIICNVKQMVSATTSGNGNIINYGKAALSNDSTTLSNGRYIAKHNTINNDSTTSQKTNKSDIVTVTLKNTTSKTVNLSVKYSTGGSYGIAVKPNESVVENFPIGTKVYKGNQFTLLKKPLYVITNESNAVPLIIKE